MREIKMPKTVFAKLPKGASSDARITALTNRKAVVLYFLFFVWGVITAITNIPTITTATSDLYQLLFSSSVAIISWPALIGALFFPKLGRIELYSSIALICLIGTYLFFVLQSSIVNTDLAQFSSFILICSTLIIPVGRCIFIFRQLLRKGEH